MLSILIPTYNYNVLPMVEQLHRQADSLGIIYEIIIFDDASPDAVAKAENEKINSLAYCKYEVLPKNIGRSAIRNLLAKTAKFDWLLFLDADTIPATDCLIKNYLPHLNGTDKIVYGGIKYQEDKPKADKLLRWEYGNEREAIPAEDRNKTPYLSLLTLNFAVKKSIFDKVKFNETIPNLRHEDTLFSYDLKQENVVVEHIDNNVYHLGLDTSTIFIEKSKEAVVGLKYLLDNKLLEKDYIRIAKVYYTLKKWRLNGVAAYLYTVSKNTLKKNFTSTHPSMFLFDIYRLCYLCTL
ncbi:glycosyltransferase family 2 protein [Flavobacterium arcticum]|uniref:Glycosyltransferase family 2 protein n=1 Tax=Flavobacterium arcticum TaxID=1784713 RepID=A0A345HEC5_9FLAO|nr:glycosyltransferase [Flavobacterium arcticum]AXG74935.1 glycosyltransferase family 2 protein [Flavobacterium arcticum]KAF2506488.1 glycosyltransferase family 2 protein [Flavobacterium arcticum]